MGRCLVEYFKTIGKPQWGQVDCNIIALDLLGAPNVIGQYSSQKEAYKFYKNYHTTWDKTLPQYAQPVDHNFAQPGDLLFTKHKHYVEVRFWNGHQTISLDMDKELIIATKGLPLDVEIWRVKNGK